MALAPRRPLLGVPSSSIMRAIDLAPAAVASMPVQRRGDLAVDVLDRLERALAEVARLVAVAQFHRFVLAGGGAGGHGRASHAAVGQIDIRFHRGIAAGIQNLSSN